MPVATSLSPEQKIASDAILSFIEDRKPQLTIGGYAGTGKTFLVAHTLEAIRELDKIKTIALACFTGKAAFVLREKLTDADALEDEYCGTIHGLMYEPILREGLIEGWKRRDRIDADLVIIDEASMVSEEIYKDLCHYKVPLLFIGDHGQLPPIGNAFSLMQNPDHALTEIQRQAANNPIIQLSQWVRNEGYIPEGQSLNDFGGWGKIHCRLHDIVGDTRDPGTVMWLCGYNKTRVFLNGAIRDRLGFTTPDPQQGEKLICLRNNREIGIFNGMTGLLKKYKPGPALHSKATILMEDGATFTGDILKAQFGASTTLREMDKVDPRMLRELFDWGYALTVHKAQGSEAERVILVEERFSAMDDDTWRRWLYTGVTRARKYLTVVARVRS